MRFPFYVLALTFAFGIGYNFGTPDYKPKKGEVKDQSLLERQWNHMSKANREQALWLARAVYSETKERPEMVSIAWTVRNRVETHYRGSTYKEVVLHHDQFSGLNPEANHYDHNMNMNWKDRKTDKAWKSALKVSIGVKQSLAYLRPFEKDVRHFYSPTATNAPNWAIGHKAVRLIRKDHSKTRSLENVRFAFYKDIE